MKTIKDNKFRLLILAIILIICLLIIYLRNNKKDKKIEEITIIETTTTIKEEKVNYIDIKGSVKNPGVYEFKENDRVIDAINKAGGLTKDANTTNINLSQKLKSEMVIYVYNNSEIKDNAKNLTCDNICKTEVIEVNNCVDIPKKAESNEESNDIININTASLEELMTLSGIGESKAKNIIEYRSSNGKFNTIDDIKNINGIGESLFNKIKEKIKV